MFNCAYVTRYSKAVATHAGRRLLTNLTNIRAMYTMYIFRYFS